MDFVSTFILAFGLAMDAVAVSISCSISARRLSLGQAFRIAFFFGLFQGVMPVFGWLAGVGFRSLIRSVDHWIALGLLSLIGGHMIFESFKEAEDCDGEVAGPLSLWALLGLSVATSIDALAAGVSFAVLQGNIVTAVSIIGVVTFVLSFLGTRLGKRLGCRFGARVERLGGFILIGIGVKIVIEHLVKNI